MFASEEDVAETHNADSASETEAETPLPSCLHGRSGGAEHGQTKFLGSVNVMFALVLLPVEITPLRKFVILRSCQKWCLEIKSASWKRQLVCVRVLFLGGPLGIQSAWQ